MKRGGPPNQHTTRRGERVFLFDESASRVVATPDPVEWELAIADHGGNVEAAAQACDLGNIPRSAKALWGRSAEHARSDYKAYRRKRTKQISQAPRAKRMNRAGRLRSAKAWLESYQGKNVLRGYRKHFAVDWTCAAIELRMLGVELDSDDVDRVCRLEPAPKDVD